MHAFTDDVIALKCHCSFRDGHTPEWMGNLDRLKHGFDDGHDLT